MEIIERLQYDQFQTFQYNPKKRLFISGEQKIGLTDLIPRKIPRTPELLPEEYYTNAFLVARGAMECVQMPKMTRWLQGLSAEEGIRVERSISAIMQDVFTRYRRERRERKVPEIARQLRVSISDGLSNFALGNDIVFGYTYTGRRVTEKDMDDGYVELSANNLEDFPGESVKVAFLAGAGALALQVATEQEKNS